MGIKRSQKFRVFRLAALVGVILGCGKGSEMPAADPAKGSEPPIASQTSRPPSPASETPSAPEPPIADQTKGSDSPLMGRWKFKDIVAPPGFPPQQLKLVQNAFAPVVAEFKRDKTFLLPMPNAPIAGVWSMSGTEIKLETKTIATLPPEQYKKAEMAKLEARKSPLAERMKDQPADPGLNAKLSTDGKTLEIRPRTSATLTFTKL